MYMEDSVSCPLHHHIIRRGNFGVDGFIKVVDALGHEYYGGNQSWFTSNTRARAGCGPVSGANVLLVLCKRNPEIASRLCVTIQSDGQISKDDYMNFLDAVYQTMGTWEIPILRKIYDRCKRDNLFFKKVSPNNGRSICGYLRGVLRFAGENDVYLQSHAFPTAHCDPEQGLEFIRDGLSSAGAVGMLTSYNRHPLTLFHGEYQSIAEPYQARDPMQNHFVTITGITADGQLYVSTWGRIARIDYAALAASWNSSRALDSALIYFTSGVSETETKRCIREAAGVLRRAVFQAVFASKNGLSIHLVFVVFSIAISGLLSQLLEIRCY